MKMKRFLIIIAFFVIVLLIWKGSVALFSEKRQLSFKGGNEILVNDEGFLYQISSDARNVGEFIEKHEISLGENDFVYPQKDTALFAGRVVEISRNRSVVIEVDEKEIEHNTFERTVGAVLKEAGVKLGNLDTISPARLEMIEDGEEIVVTRINIERVSVTKEIDFERIEKNDDKLQWKKEDIQQKGENGEKIIEYQITYKNGEEVSKEIISTNITKKPINEIVRIGTKIKVGKVKTGISSWYRYTGKLTCASRIFPRGTWLRVTNNENGKQVIVEVRDFGPAEWTGRRIDLEAVAFEQIASLGKGLVNVKVEEILQ